MIKRKILTSISTIGLLTAPITVMSCGVGGGGDDVSGAVGKTYSDVTLRLGYRLSEADFYQEALEAFSATTGVTFKFEAGEPNTYSSKYATQSGLADVTLVEGEPINVKAVKGGWFTPFDASDLTTNPKYNDFTYEGDYSKYALDTDLKVVGEGSENWVNKPIFDSAKIKTNGLTKGKYNYLPTQLGPKMIFAWNEDKSHRDLFDGKHDLKWYVPTALGEDGTSVQDSNTAYHVQEVTTFGTTHDTNPLLKADGTHYKNTIQDVKAFLANSARESERKFNNHVYNWTSLHSSEAKDRVIATGEPGFRQRLYSVITTLKKSASFDIPKLGIIDYSTFSIPMIASGTDDIKDVYNEANADAPMANENGMSIVKDAQWAANFTNIPQTNVDSSLWDFRKPYTMSDVTTNAIPNSWVKMYLGQFGYYTDGIAGLKSYGSLNAGEEIQPFADQDTWFVYGQKWMQPGVVSRANIDPKHIDDHLFAIPTTFCDPGCDGFAVKSGITGKKRDAAFALLRFFMNKQVQAEMAGTKTVPMFAKGSEILINEATTEFDKVAGKMGFSSLGDDINDKIHGISDYYARQSDTGVLPDVNYISEHAAWQDSAGNIDFAKFLKRCNDVSHQFMSQVGINS